MSKPLQTLSSGYTVSFLLFFYVSTAFSFFFDQIRLNLSGNIARIEQDLPSSLNLLFICTVIDIFHLFLVPPMNDYLFHRFAENKN